MTASAATAPTTVHAAPRVTAIVPAHNNGRDLERCLAALRASGGEGLEVIVVDDCSSDDLRPIALQHGARYLRTPRNMGPGGARNLAAHEADGDVLLFVDADVLVAREVLPRITGHFAQDPTLVALFGSYDEQPAHPSFVSQYKNLMHHYVHQISSESPESFWAGCGAIRKRAFLEVGGFNAARFPKPSIEDIELGYRVADAGMKIRLDKQLQVKHLKRWTVRNLLHADIFCRAVPWTQLIAETGRVPRDLNLTYVARISSLLVGLIAAMVLALPFSLAGVAWFPAPAVLAIAFLVAALALLWLNREVYRWFAQRRGLLFTAGAVFFHWLYYLYSGVTFVVCTLLFRPARPGAAGRHAASAAESRD